MADQTTTVRITADASQASREMDGFAARIAAMSRQAIQGMLGVRDSLSTVTRESTQATGGMQQLAGMARLAVGALAAAAGVRALVTIADQATLADARLQQVVGSLQGARDASAALFEMSQRLQAPFAEAQAMFARMMPAVKELGGGTREAIALSEILVSTAKLGGASAAEAAAGAQQFAQALGSGVLQGDELKSILENNAVLARELAGALGVTIGELRKMGSEGKLTSDLVANALLGRADDIRARMSELPTTVGGAFTQISNAWQRFIGEMNSGTGTLGVVARMFSEVARVIELVTVQLRTSGQQAGQTAGATSAAAQTMARAIAFVADMVVALVDNLRAAGNMLGGLAASARLAMEGNFRGAGEVIADAWRRNGEAGNRLVDAMIGKGKILQGYNALLAGDGIRDERRPGAGGSDFTKLKSTAKPDEKKKAEPDSRMPEWEAQLAERRAALARQGLLEGQFREMSRAEEQKYWAEIGARAGLSSSERVALAKKTAELELAAVRETFDGKVRALQQEAETFRNNMDERIKTERKIQALYQQGTRQYEEAARRIAQLEAQKAEQIKAVAAERLAAEQSLRLSEIQIAEQALGTTYQLGLINQQQVLAAQQQFEQKRTDIYRQALQQRLTAMQADPDANPVERARILRELEQLEQQHTLRMGELRQQAALKSTEEVRGTLGNIQQGWAGLLTQLAQGTLSIGGFIRGVFQVAAQAVIQTLAQMAARWAVQQLALRVLGKAMGLSSIATEAAKAGAGGVASMAAAPFPLNLSAPAFGAAMSAAAMAFAPVASAAGGYDIGAGVNPLVQTHAREMILPAHLAETVRDMSRVYTQTRAGAPIMARQLAAAMDRPAPTIGPAAMPRINVAAPSVTAPVTMQQAVAQAGMGMGQMVAEAVAGQPTGDVHVHVPGTSAGDFFLANRTELSRALDRALKDKLRRS